MSTNKTLLTILAIASLGTARAYTQGLSPVTGFPATEANATPEPGMGHDYMHLLSETVNPANGQVSVRINLGAPGSRGVTLPAYYTYDSNAIFTLTLDPVDQEVQFDQPNELGQNNLFPVASWSESTYYYPVQTGPTSSYNVYCNEATSFTFRDTTGVSHNLGLQVIAYESNISGNGNGSCGGAPGAVGTDGQVSAAFTSPSTTYSDVNLWPASGNTTTGGAVGPFTVTDAAGNTYFFDGSASTTTDEGHVWEEYANKIEDRNGNIMTLAGCGSPSSVMYCDTAGRPVESVSGSTVTVGGVEYTFSNGGANAATVSYTVSNSHPVDTNEDLSCPVANFTVPAPYSSSIAGEEEIGLPDETSYQLFFGSNNTVGGPTNRYGLLNEIVYPDGGWVEYTWQMSPNFEQVGVFPGTNLANGQLVTGCIYEYSVPVIVQRQVSYNGSTVAESQTYTYSATWNSNQSSSAFGTWTAKSTTVQTTDKVANKTAQTVYTYAPGSLVPMEQTIQRYDWGNTTTPVDTETKGWFTNAVGPTQLACDFHTANTGQSTGHFYQYAYTQVSDDKEYDYGQIASPSSVCTGVAPAAPTSPTPLRETATTGFKTFTVPTALVPAGIAFAKPAGVITYGAGTRIAETDYTYDQSAMGQTISPALPSGTHDEVNFPPSVTTNRGNATTVTRQCIGCTNAITTFTYDETGQLASMTDACGNASCADMPGASSHKTIYSFTDSPSGGNTYGNSNAYLTQITNPLGYTEKYQYNYTYGQLTLSEDENNQITTYNYGDGLYRLTDIYGPLSQQNGTQPHTNYAYVDGTGASVTTTDPAGVVSKKLFDGIGHVIQTQLKEPGAGTGVADYVNTVYDGMGNVYSVTNPFRTTSDPTYGLTYYTYDGLGRKIVQTNPDNSVLQWCYNGVVSSLPSGVTSNCSGHLGTANAGTWVNFSDESGNQWQRTTDSLGRLTQVMEPGAASPTPTLETDYTYDALNNLLSAKQNGASGETARTRSFTYDSLSRLLSANNSETGLVCYGVSGGAGCGNTANGYDANGNLSAKTDARSITTSYAYDALNRVLSKSYSAGGVATGTPASCFQYGATTTGNLIGRLINEWTQAPPCPASPPASGLLTLRAISAYDEMGRITNEQQCTPGNCTTTSGPALGYAYDLAGDPITLTNSVGASGGPLTITNSFDGAAHLSNVVSNWTAYATCLYVLGTSGSTCNPASTPYGYGPVGPQTWSHGSNLTVNQGYTNRLWVNSISANGQVP